MKVRCWLMDRPETARDVEIDDEDELYAVADFYAAKHNRNEVGDISFVETERGDIWRVEVLFGHPLVTLLTQGVTRDDAEDEIERFLETAEKPS